MSALGYHHRRRRELIRHNLQPSGGGLLPAKATDRPRLQVSEWRLARPASRFQPCRTSAYQTALITANIYSELCVGLIIFLFPKMSRRLKNVKAPPLNVDTKVTVD